MEPKSLRGGIDVGSTTVKVVIMDENNDSVYQTYQRHFSDVKKASEKVLRLVWIRRFHLRLPARAAWAWPTS